MKKNHTILLSAFVIVTLALVKVAPGASFLTAGLREPSIVPAPDYWPTGGWQSRSPEEMGIDSNRLAKGLLQLQENGSSIDSLLIIHDGYIVLDAYFAPYDGSFPHHLASVTKSITTTLIAIAAEQGYIDLDRSMVSYFPNRTIANLDERKERVTLRHLMGMVASLSWCDWNTAIMTRIAPGRQPKVWQGVCRAGWMKKAAARRASSARRPVSLPAWEVTIAGRSSSAAPIPLPCSEGEHWEIGRSK